MNFHLKNIKIVTKPKAINRKKLVAFVLPIIRKEKLPVSEELEKLIGQVQKQMKAAAAELNFEMAAELRDKMITLKKSLDDMEE